MSQTPPPDLITRVKEILLPLLRDDGAREAILIEAFYLCDDPLLQTIEFTGAANVFTVRLIRKLLDYGCVPGGEHSLARLLITAKYGCGADKHADIDALIGIVQGLRQPPAPSSPSAPSLPLPPPATPTPAGASVQTVDTPRADRRPTVFISYTRADAELANQLIADLNANGHACWVDTTSIKGGEVWIRAIADGIINSYALVPLMTMNALESSWMRKEILWAQERGKLIIPWILEDVKKEPGFLLLADCQGITLYDQPKDGALKTLLRSLPRPETIEVSAEKSVEATPPPPTEHIARKMELAYLDRLRLEELLNTARYTPMAGSFRERQPEMRAVFEFVPMRKGTEQHRETRRIDKAVDEELRSIRRAVLLGEPGGGKTTTIWKLADNLLQSALKDRQAPIPLLIRLGRWTAPEQSLHDFIASQLGDLGEYLDELLTDRRAALLLDGLNELPAGQRGAKYPQVKRLIEQHGDLLAVVSCRELDYTVDLGFDLVNITPLDPPRIQEFSVRYLGETKGEALFWRLAGQKAQNQLDAFLKEFAGKLADPERTFWIEPQLPGNLKWGHENWTWNNWLRLREQPSSLMVLARNPYMLLMLTSVYREDGELPDNRGDLFRRFVEQLLKREEDLLKREAVSDAEQTALMDGLAKVAYAMQVRRADDETGDALTVLPKQDVSKAIGDRLLYLAGSASILSVGEQVRFTHQLLQEYFAARYMDLEIKAGRLKASDIWPREKWWERTNWEEASILLAGLYSNDCSPIVEWAAEVNPEVAAMCIVRSGAQCAPATKERLRSKWLPSLADLKSDPDPKARAAVGRALGMIGLDHRRGIGTIVDKHGFRLPDIDWVAVPAGEFQYGLEEGGAGNFWKPATPQKLTLPAFHISRYPVTYAQFQTFVDDPEGLADPRWFEGLAANEEERRIDAQYFKFANHPRETVSWYQALAFCRWLSWRLGGGYDLNKIDEWAVRLPTEFEWEKAARGTDGRIYPYKGEFDAAKGNTSETGLRQTSAVGIFPNGASPYGIMDMSGNVLEWCLSDFTNPAPDAQSEKLDTDNIRVLRGGSWLGSHLFARAVDRNFLLPAYRGDDIGFRLLCVVSPPSL